MNDPQDIYNQLAPRFSEAGFPLERVAKNYDVDPTSSPIWWALSCVTGKHPSGGTRTETETGNDIAKVADRLLARVARLPATCPCCGGSVGAACHHASPKAADENASMAEGIDNGALTP